MADPNVSSVQPNQQAAIEVRSSEPRDQSRWILLAGLVLAALLTAAALATGYPWANRLWLLTGSLVAVGLVGIAVAYASRAHDSFARESEADRQRHAVLAASYAQIATERVMTAKAMPGSIEPHVDEQTLTNASAALDRAAGLAQDAAPNDRAVVSATMVMNIVVFVVSGLVVVSFWAAGDRGSWADSIVWSAACLLLGGTAGFLFGIPRFRSEGKTPQTASQRGGGSRASRIAGGEMEGREVVTRPVTATNDQSPIEQIADWLTKTIVGVALVNLKALPEQLHRWALVVAGGIGSGNADARIGLPGVVQLRTTSFALGLILYFTVLGFLSGYLLTQFFLQRYVNRNRLDS